MVNITMKIYRNIFFHNKIPSLRGTDVVYYTGKLVVNASKSKSFLTEYDSKLDLYIPCGSCAAKKYSQFIKK